MNLRKQTWWQKLISCPLTDLNFRNCFIYLEKTPIFFKDSWNSFTNSFLSGH